MRFHDLQYGEAATLQAEGASLQDILAIPWYSEYKSTLVYAHVVPELVRQNAERMQAALG